MNRTMRVSIALFLLAMSVEPAQAQGQAPSTTPRDETSYEVIDTPPGPAAPSQAAPTGVILDRPGRVLVSGTPVKVRFQSPTSGVSFHLRMGGSYSLVSGVSVGWGGGYGWGGYGIGYGAAPYYGEVVTRAYQPICEAPCDATLLSGRHRLALSLDGNRPIEAKQPIDLGTDAIVEGRYVDKSRIRKAGWAIFAAGAITGMALMFASVNYRYDPIYYGQQVRYPAMFYTGVGLLVSSIITGSVLASQDDEAHVNVYPVK
jgi:hypothetical protein